MAKTYMVDGVVYQMTAQQEADWAAKETAEQNAIEAVRPLEKIKDAVNRRDIKMKYANAFMRRELQQGNITLAAFRAWINDINALGTTLSTCYKERYLAGSDEIMMFLNSTNDATLGNYSSIGFLSKTTTYAPNNNQAATNASIARRDKLVEILTDSLS